MAIEEIKNVYAELPRNVNTSFDQIYQQAERMASQVGVKPSKPRISGMQLHRSNAPADTIKDHYLKNVAIPFLDHIIVQLDTRFTKL